MVKATWLDRAIGFFAPGAAARRARERAAFEVLTRGYDGAQRGRKTLSWRAGPTSADAEIAHAGPLLRDRMRDLVRNNPHAAKAVSELVSHIVGDGIVPRARTGNGKLDERVNRLFESWAKECDADGQLDFFGLQTLVVREMIESGDGLIRRRRRRAEDGLTVPLQLQVIETDLIDGSKNGPTNGGGVIIQGIEHDAIGKRTAYWMFPTHPGNAVFDPKGASESRPVPASEILHLYEKQRTQVRGVPWGSPVIMSLQNLGSYEEAELVRKRLEACMVGVLIPGDDDGELGIPTQQDNGPGLYDQDGFAVEKFEPGMFVVAHGGKDIKFSQPAITSNYDTYKRSMLHTIAAGFRVPYAILSGDLSQVNYSSSKIGLEGFRRLISAVQWQMVIPMICEPVWRWFIEAAYLAGHIDTTDIPVEWTPPRFYSADPARDVAATIAEVRAGFKSPQEAISERGWNPDDVLREIAEFNQKLDALGIVLDSDPRRITQAGQFQPKLPDQEGQEDG